MDPSLLGACCGFIAGVAATAFAIRHWFGPRHYLRVKPERDARGRFVGRPRTDRMSVVD